MSFLKDIVTDLREKRLWPVVAVLAVALVALPVVLGRGGGAPASSAAPITLPPVAPAAADTGHVVNLVAPTGKVRATGRAHDPFGQPGGPAKTTPNTATPPPPAPGSTFAPTPQPSAPSPSSTGVQSPVSSPSPSPSAPAPSAPTSRGADAGYRVDLSFGQAGSTKALHDALRLRGLQAVDGPLAVFLGVREKPKAATFLLAPGTSATGDGRCRPNPRDCQVLELAKDESEFFDVPNGAAGVVQYELDVDRIVARREASATRAHRVLHQQSKAGRKLMFDLVRAGQTYLSHYMYSSSTGVLGTHIAARKTRAVGRVVVG